MELSSLPLELNYKILSYLPIKSLILISWVNKHYNRICNDDYFWRDKTINDYGITRLGNGLTWKKYYFGFLKKLPVFVSYPINKIIGMIPINKYDLIRENNLIDITELIDRVRSLFINKFGDKISMRKVTYLTGHYETLYIYDDILRYHNISSIKIIIGVENMMKLGINLPKLSRLTFEQHKDVQLVVSQTNVSSDRALMSLINNDWDIVESIMEL